MMIDSNELAAGHRIRADVCIVGTGPAGMAVAKSLAGTGRSVCMLESGGLEPEPAAQAQATVRSIGEDCFDPSHRRVFAFGGTTWMWSGWCRPFDPIDFTRREWVPDSGWPIPYDDVSPYFEEAARFLGLDEVHFDRELFEKSSGLELWRIPGNTLESKLFRVMKQPSRLGRLYKEFFTSSPSITVYCHAHVRHLIPDTSRSRFASVSFCDSRHRIFDVDADTIVLAAGGIDNPRLILATQDRFSAQGLKFSDATGRYFMIRLHAGAGHIQSTANRAADPSPYNHSREQAVCRLFLTGQAQQHAGLMRYNVSFIPLPKLNPATILPFAAGAGGMSRRRFIIASSAAAAYLLANGCSGQSPIPAWKYRVNHTAEQSPNWSSRIRLSDELDPLGNRMVAVDWHSQFIDRKTMYHGARLTASVLDRWGKAAMTLDGFGDDDAPWPPDAQQGRPGHYMGATRMGTNKDTSVVDPDGRVHDFENLFVAGSSVFPTSGNGTPTLTLVALALRLGRHLQNH